MRAPPGLPSKGPLRYGGVIYETEVACIYYSHPGTPPGPGLIFGNGAATLEKRATTSARKRVLFCQLINPNPIVKP